MQRLLTATVSGPTIGSISQQITGPAAGGSIRSERVQVEFTSIRQEIIFN